MVFIMLNGFSSTLLTFGFYLALAAKKMEPSFVFRTLMAYLTLTAIYFIQSIFC